MSNFREEFSKKFKTVGRVKELTEEIKNMKRKERKQIEAETNLSRVIKGELKGRRRRR